MKFENYQAWVDAVKKERDKLFAVRYYLSTEGTARYSAYETLLGLTVYCDTAAELMEFLDQKHSLHIDTQKNLSSPHLILPLKNLELLAKEEKGSEDPIAHQNVHLNDVKVIEVSPRRGTARQK